MPRRAVNLADALSEQARLRPDAVAVHLPETVLRFREFDQRVWRACAVIHRAGVRRGDVVALSCTHELLLLTAMLALARLGATAFSIPLQTPAAQAAEMAGSVQARYWLRDHAQPEIDGVDAIVFTLEALAQERADADPALRDPVPEAPWLVISGSGSTGRPKLIAVSHAQCLARLRLYGERVRPSPADRVLSLIHPDFPSAKNQYLNALFAGAALVLYDRQRTDVLKLCAQARVSIVYAAVIHLELLLERAGPGTEPAMPSLRALVPAGSTISDSLRERVMRRLTPQLYVRYGASEVGPICDATPEEVARCRGTVGRPLAGVEIDIVSAQGQVLPKGHTGLVRIRSIGAVDRYLDDETASRRAFRDGWFLPGDLGKLEGDGQLIFCGRADGMMIMNGINIYPAEIEQALLAHPAISDCAVASLASAPHQDIPIAVVVLCAEATTREPELLAYLRGRLGGRAPQRLLRVERVPRDAQGKLARTELVALIANHPAIAASKAVVRPDERTDGEAAVMRVRRPVEKLRLLRFQLPPVTASDLERLEPWLRVALRIDLEGLPPLASASGDADLLTGFAWRFLLYWRAMLQAAAIPAFDPGHPVQVQADAAAPGRWQVAVALPELGEVPAQQYAAIALDAMRWLLWCVDRPLAEEQRQRLYAALGRQVLQPLRRYAANGKSTLPVLRAAHRLDIPFLHLGGSAYQLGWGARARRMERSSTDRDAAMAARLSQDKLQTAALLRMAGLPAPEHAQAVDAQTAQGIALRFGGAVVVKPVDGDRGEGVAVGLRDGAAVSAAFEEARKRSPSRRVLVEREVAGVCHRLFISGGQLLYAVKRLPKSVIGDGARTVAGLIAQARSDEAALPPWQRSEPYPDDALAIATMAAGNWTLDAVPPAGVPVPLRPIESTAWGGFDVDVSKIVHPDNLDIALRAAALLGLENAGVDIISTDIARPWYENGAILNEVNFAPLLGGGEISRRHLPRFFERFIDGDGRIPVSVVVGGDEAWELARRRQQQWRQQGVSCFATSHDRSLMPAGDELRVPVGGLRARCRALLLNRAVEAIVLVVQTDECLRHGGLPVDRWSEVQRAAGILRAADGTAAPLSEARERRLMRWLTEGRRGD